ncbi:MAG: hypothetical protein HQK60_08915, partial [Deltaproteobacteria bacterium]|nr:hypothetical protein [Deltaproteobacteria bacterium]
PGPLPVPLPMDPEAFWGPPISPADLVTGEAIIPAVHAALPKRLGGFPFWRGQVNFFEALEEMYRQASPAGLEIFLCTRKSAYDK